MQFDIAFNNMDKKIQNKLHEIRQDLMQQIETSHETPQAKAALKAMFGNMTDEEFIQIAYPGYREDKHETVGEVPIEFAHPTIGFNHQPRQWFLVVNITDIEEFVHLGMYGPDSKPLNAAINFLFRDSILLYHELTVGGTLEYALRVAQFFNGSATSKIFHKGK